MTEFIYYTDSENSTGFGNKIIKAIKDVVGVETREVHKVHDGMNIFKSQGIWKWVGVFTNNFRDNDIRPEIFSADSHRRYVNRIDLSEKALPELWLYHEEAWKIGKASFVALDEHEDDIVFVIVGGDIDVDKSDVAEKLANPRQLLKMSHGVPAGEIVRNKDDNSIFDDYWSSEVSVVPGGLEANPLTAFGILGDSNMIAQHKREEMKAALGVDDSLLDGLEAVNAQVAADENGSREHKSLKKDTEVVAEVAVEVEGAVVEETSTDVETEVVAETVEPVVPDKIATDEVSQEEVVQEVVEEQEFTQGDNLVNILAGMAKSINLIVDRLESTEKTMDDLVAKEKEEKVVEPVAAAAPVPAPETPVAFSVFDSLKSSIIGRNAAAVKDTDDGLDKQPDEAESEEKSRTGSTLVDSLIAGSMKR